MRAMGIIRKSGIAFLAGLILFLSTGIHDVTSHTAPASAPAIQQKEFSVHFPAQAKRDHCSACFVCRLLNQCLFPVSEMPLATKSLHVRAYHEIQAVHFLVLRSEVNRGPPAAIA
jgi:hypothetical protein